MQDNLSPEQPQPDSSGHLPEPQPSESQPESQSASQEVSQQPSAPQVTLSQRLELQLASCRNSWARATVAVREPTASRMRSVFRWWVNMRWLVGRMCDFLATFNRHKNPCVMKTPSSGVKVHQGHANHCRLAPRLGSKTPFVLPKRAEMTHRAHWHAPAFRVGCRACTHCFEALRVRWCGWGKSTLLRHQRCAAISLVRASTAP